MPTIRFCNSCVSLKVNGSIYDLLLKARRATSRLLINQITVSNQGVQSHVISGN